MNIKALTRSTTLTIWLITAMTIWSELSSSFKVFLTDVSGHHWTAKGLFSLIFFTLVYYMSVPNKKKFNLSKEINYVMLSAILGGLIIFGFFIEHFIS
jgi:hypothetical protein